MEDKSFTYFEKGMVINMKKKRPTKMVSILCFIAAVFFAVFVLMEFRSDYIAVGGAGIVLLITAYFLINRIEEDINKKYERDRQDIHKKFEEISHSIDEKWNRLEVILKGIYVVTKKGTNTFERKQEDIDIQKQGIDVIVNKIETVIQSIDKLNINTVTSIDEAAVSMENIPKEEI